MTITIPTRAAVAAPERVPQLPALTGIRFVAAAYVVLYHFLFPHLTPPNRPLQHLMGNGYSAVSFFFVLSGFVLSYTYIGRTGQPVHRERFWLARFSRIYPAYVLAFLIAAPFQIAGSLRVNGLWLGAEKLLVGAVLYLTLLQAWTPWTAWYWNIPAWSLSVEAFFYFCFPFIAASLAPLEARQCLRWAIVAWLLAVAVPGVYTALWPVSGHYPAAMAQLAVETNPVMHLPEFLLGMLIGRLFTKGARLSAPTAARLAVIALIALIGVLAVSPSTMRVLVSNGLTAPVSSLLIFTLAHQAGLLARVLGAQPFRTLGEASYAVYILQYPIAYLFRLDDQTFTIARFASYFAALVLISVLTFLYVETPIRRWMIGRAHDRLGRPVSMRVDSVAR